MIGFYDSYTRQIALFEKDTKRFRTSYRLTLNQAQCYERFGTVGI